MSQVRYTMPAFPTFSRFFRNQIFLDGIEAFAVCALLFFALIVGSQVYASTVTLSVTVNTSITFTTTTNNFTTITPGTAVYATTTLRVDTNDSLGWNVTLSGDNKNSTNNNLQTGTAPATSTQITDQTEWVPGSATTSPGTAVAIGSLINSGNVLAFRVMSASSTNGAPFLATTWWGANDGASALWAGISSSTVSRQIGNAGSGSYSATTHINTVNYYLNVASTQPTGTYTAPITYTATGN